LTVRIVRQSAADFAVGVLKYPENDPSSLDLLPALVLDQKMARDSPVKIFLGFMLPAYAFEPDAWALAEGSSSTAFSQHDAA